MRSLVIRRLALIVPLLLCVAAVNFAIVNSIPGDPLHLFFGESGGADPAATAGLRARLGLDRPLPVRFGAYIGELVQGNLGTSIMQGRPVTVAILERLPATLLLAGAGLILATGLGLGLGVLLAVMAIRTPRVERGFFMAVMLGTNLPPYVAGLILILVFSLLLGFFPSQGITQGRDGGPGVLAHLVLPALTLALQPLVGVARVTRARLLEVLTRAHIRTARAGGLTRTRILFRHGLKATIPAPLTLLALTAAGWAGGAVLTETVFGWPGVGRLAVEATLARDYPLIVGLVLFGTLLVVTINLAVDVSLAILDPRARSG
ncbi:MAG: ABC transporter permease [Gemmatimonadota bacterium]